jgi:hypothetical protein
MKVIYKKRCKKDLDETLIVILVLLIPAAFSILLQIWL